MNLARLQQKIEENPKLKAVWDKIPVSRREEVLKNIFQKMVLKQLQSKQAKKI